MILPFGTHKGKDIADVPVTGGEFHLLRFSKEHADFAHHYWNELDDAWEQFLLLRTITKQEEYEIYRHL